MIEASASEQFRAKREVKAVGGGLGVKFYFTDILIDSENLGYVGTETFYGIEKSSF